MKDQVVFEAQQLTMESMASSQLLSAFPPMVGRPLTRRQILWLLS